jgi:hypothetical protein
MPWKGVHLGHVAKENVPSHGFKTALNIRLETIVSKINVVYQIFFYLVFCNSVCR